VTGNRKYVAENTKSHGLNFGDLKASKDEMGNPIDYSEGESFLNRGPKEVHASSILIEIFGVPLRRVVPTPTVAVGAQKAGKK